MQELFTTTVLSIVPSVSVEVSVSAQFSSTISTQTTTTTQTTVTVASLLPASRGNAAATGGLLSPTAVTGLFPSAVTGVNTEPKVALPVPQGPAVPGAVGGGSILPSANLRDALFIDGEDPCM